MQSLQYAMHCRILGRALQEVLAFAAVLRQIDVLKRHCHSLKRYYLLANIERLLLQCMRHQNCNHGIFC